MVAMELIDLLSKEKLESYIGTDDFADRLSYFYSVSILSVLAMIITVKSYVFEPLACYAATAPESGSNFDQYMLNLCWVNGTIPIADNEHLNMHTWKAFSQRQPITYYQWVPFVLCLQLVMYYTPRIIWQMVCTQRLGTDIQCLIDTVKQAAHASDEATQKANLDQASDALEMMMFYNKNNRRGALSSFRRRLNNICSMCVVSKKMGSWLVFFYLFVKLLYALNAIGQLFLIKHFLNYKGTVFEMGNDLLQNLRAGDNGNSTLIFPKKAMCQVSVRQLGQTNKYMAQCVLPINILNEKIYVFLYFWTSLVVLVTLTSLFTWTARMALRKNRRSFVKKFLRIAESYRSDQPGDRALLTTFLDQFLRQDGVFLLRIMSLNVGDVVTAEVVVRLWTVYKLKYSKIDLNYDIRSVTV